MIRLKVARLIAVLLLLDCAYVRPLTSETSVQADLVGQHLRCGSQFIPNFDTVLAVSSWQLLQRSTNRRAGIDTLYAAVNLESKEQFEGNPCVLSTNLMIVYRLYDQGWQLENVSPYSECTKTCTPSRTH
jgi:hypothetical protein